MHADNVAEKKQLEPKFETNSTKKAIKGGASDTVWCTRLLPENERLKAYKCRQLKKVHCLIVGFGNLPNFDAHCRNDVPLNAPLDARISNSTSQF